MLTKVRVEMSFDESKLNERAELIFYEAVQSFETSLFPYAMTRIINKQMLKNIEEFLKKFREHLDAFNNYRDIKVTKEDFDEIIKFVHMLYEEIDDRKKFLYEPSEKVMKIFKFENHIEPDDDGCEKGF